MIDINELRRLAQAVSEWSSCNQAWLDQSEDVPVATAGHIDEGGNTYPIATIDCDQYYAAHQSLPLAKFYAAANPATVAELLDRLEAAEKDAALKGEVIDSLAAVVKRLDAQCDAAEKGRDVLNAKVERMEQQEPVAWHTFDGEGGYDCRSYAMKKDQMDSLISRLQRPGYDLQKEQAIQEVVVELRRLNAERGLRAKIEAAKSHCTQPTPSAPREAIEKMLTQLMDIAVSNGANSISMPDEYVEVAAWLCGIPAQPAPRVPDGWKLVPIGPTQEMIDHVIDERLDALAAGKDHTFIDIYKAMLAAAPEAKS